MNIPRLPKGATWPRGWWVTPKRGLNCCGARCQWNKRCFPKGILIFLTGTPGEVFCKVHAVRRGNTIPAVS